MSDKYSCFAELIKCEKPNLDFRVRHRQGSPLLIIAPHGGGIEPGTSEIADAIAGDTLSFYAFEGTKPRNNRDLHITSTRFDEPCYISVAKHAQTIVAIHGEESEREVVFLGGRDTERLVGLSASLRERGFHVETHPNPRLHGCDQRNICNRGTTGSGIQLELSKGLRRSFFHSLTRIGCQRRTERFWDFVAAVRHGIS